MPSPTLEVSHSPPLPSPPPPLYPPAGTRVLPSAMSAMLATTKNKKKPTFLPPMPGDAPRHGYRVPGSKLKVIDKASKGAPLDEIVKEVVTPVHIYCGPGSTKKYLTSSEEYARWLLACSG